MLQHQVKAAAHLLLSLSLISFLALSRLQAAARPLALIKMKGESLPREEGCGLEPAGFDGSVDRVPSPQIQMVTGREQGSASVVASKHHAKPLWEYGFHHVGWLHNMLDAPSSGSNNGGNSQPTTANAAIGGGLMAVLRKPTTHMMIEDASERLTEQSSNDEDSATTVAAHRRRHQLQSHSISGAETEISGRSSILFAMLSKKTVPTSGPSPKHN